MSRFKNLKTYIVVAITWLILSACGGGKCLPNGNTPSGISELNLTISAPSEYPAGVAVTVPAVVTNTSDHIYDHLSYRITNNTTDAAISITEQSLTNCQTLESGQNCSLAIEVPANSHSGSFSIIATSSSEQSKLSSIISSTIVTEVQVSIGLTELPLNNGAGVNGITEYYNNVVSLPNNNSGIAIVSFAVTSANAGAFNTIELLDGSGNQLEYQVLTGNSGSGLTALSQGAVVSLAVQIPSGATQLSFYPTLKLNGNTIANGSAASPTTITVLRPTSEVQGALSIVPSNFILNESNPTQIVTVWNNGNGTASNIMPNITAPMTINTSSSTCGLTLAAGAICTYTVNFDAVHSDKAGTGVFTVNYNTGVTTSSDTSTFNYKGNLAVADLMISSGSNPNFNFRVTTSNPSTASLVTITNNGVLPLESFSYTLPSYFSESTETVVNPCTQGVILQPNQSCNVSLVYTNSTITSPTTAAVIVNYHYFDQAANVTLTGSSTVAVTYQTVQSQAILTVTPSPVSFGNVLNNNNDLTSQVITITNSGDIATTNTPSITLATLGSLYSISNNTCTGPINASGSCTVTVTAGPVESTVTAGTKTNTLSATYQPYPSAASNTTNTALTTQVVTAQTAIITVTESSAIGFAGGNGESSGSPYMLQSDSSAAIMYTITNSGSVPATNFVIRYFGEMVIGLRMVNNCPLTLNSNSSCTVTFNFSRPLGGVANIPLPQYTLSWVDQDSPTGQSQPMGSNATYVTVFSAPQITFSPESVIISPSGNASVTVTLTGGYNVTNQTIVATDNTGGALSSITTAPSPCILNSQSVSCVFTFAANSNAVTGSYSVGMTNTTGSIVIPSSISVSITPPAWIYFGAPNISTGAVYSGIQSVFDNNNNLYVAFISSVTGNYSVMKYESGSWNYAGDPEFAANNGGGFWFAVNQVNNTPYLLQRSGQNYFQLWMLNTGSNTWESVGSQLRSIVGGNYVGLGSLAFNPLNGNPYVAYTSNDVNYTLQVKEFESNAWSLIASESAQSTPLQMLFESTGALYLVKIESDSTIGINQVTSGSVNLLTSINGYRGSNSYFPSVKIGSNNNIYLAFSDGANSNKLSIVKYDGSTVTYLGTGVTRNATSPNTSVSLALDSNNVPYVAYVGSALGTLPNVFLSSTFVVKYINSGWSQVAGAPFVSGNFGLYGLAINQQTNYPYLGFQDTSVSGASGTSVVYYPSSN